ncbi:ABC transporter permease [Streptomyces shenzhenensis]|uniref:ABC transporter permease n=1 Tax=Streptomyces shenzhenensis TaxID=943815 RepID=UPI001F394D2E|nr:FtsX-like permease family protein [Streptomyces shenzhenensis]
MLLKTSLRSFFAHKGRLALSLIAIALSVGFVSGTLVFSNTATKTVDSLFSSTVSDVSVIQTPAKHGIGPSTGTPLTMPASMLQKVDTLPGVKTALGKISVNNAALINPKTNKVAGPFGGASAIIGAWGRDPRSPLKITSGRAPSGPDDMLVDADTAKKSGLHLGSPVRVINSLGTFDYTVSGIASFTTTNPGSAMAFLQRSTAEHDLLGATGVFTSIEVYGDGHVSNNRLKSEITPVIGRGYQAKTASEQEANSTKDTSSFLSFVKAVLLGFATIAVVVGGFLIINTFSMLVTQRTREIGLLRALGAGRRQVNRSVLIEALLLGVVGSTLGMFAGLGVAFLLAQLMTPAGIPMSSSLVFDRTVPIASYGVGIVITVLSAWLPARRASRISPMAALSEHGISSDKAANRKRIVIGLLVTILGAAALVEGAVKSSKPLVETGAVFLLVAFVVLGPLLATGIIGVLGRVLPALFGASGKLAQLNAVRNPRRTGATAAALTIGLCLVTGFSVESSSLVASTNSQVAKSLGADYLVTTGPTNGLTPAMLDATRNTPGIDHVTEEKYVLATITTGKVSQNFTLTAVSPSITRDFHAQVVAGSLQSVNEGAVTVDQTFAKNFNLKVGDEMTIDYGKGHVQKVPIGVITAKNNPFFDRQIYIGISTLAKALPATLIPPDNVFLCMAANGADKDKTYDALQHSLRAYPMATVQDHAGFNQMFRDNVNALLYIIYALLALAISVAVLGVINTLALSVVERTREIGLLRAVGLSRVQLRRMIRLESVTIAVFGALIGTCLGLAWGIAFQHANRKQGMGVLSVPVTTIAMVLVLSAVVGLVAALVPAFRAGRMNILRAIAAD